MTDYSPEILKDYPGAGDVLAVPRAFIQATGDLAAATLLSQIVYWQRIKATPDGWFYKSAADWKCEIGLSRFQVKEAAKKLIPFGLETKIDRAGRSNVTYYRVNCVTLKKLICKKLTGEKLHCEETAMSHMQETATSNDVHVQVSLTSITETTDTETTTEITDSAQPAKVNQRSLPSIGSDVQPTDKASKPDPSKVPPKVSPAKDVRPRDLLFDAITLHVFGINPENKQSVDAVGGRVAKLKKRLIAIYPDATPTEICEQSAWYQRKNTGANMPRDADKYLDWFGQYRQVKAGDKPVQVAGEEKQLTLEDTGNGNLMKAVWR